MNECMKYVLLYTLPQVAVMAGFLAAAYCIAK